jgi:hypothetical protein
MSLLTSKPRKVRRRPDAATLWLAVGLMTGGAIVTLIFLAAL